jgi:NitT/TauT family transport system permease protein
MSAQVELTIGTEVRSRRSMPSIPWRRALVVVYPLAAAVVLLVAWQAAVVVFDVKQYILPKPTEVLSMMFNERTYLIDQAKVTLQEIVLGFALSVAVGLPLALAITLWRPVERSLYPLVIASQAVPKVAIAPLFIVWFGFGMLPKVLVVTLIGFFPVLVNSITGFRSIETEKIYLAQSMGASKLQTFVKFRLPNALPSIFAGLKLAATMAVLGAVVAEFLGAEKGLGRVLTLANGNLDTPLLFAAVGYLSIIGLAVFGLMGLAERAAIPWHTSHRKRGR